MGVSASLNIFGMQRGPDVLLRPQGHLDAGTYGQLRDAVLKCAVELPRSVIVDVDAMTAASASCWSVFVAVHWQIESWPNVLVVVVCADPGRRSAMQRTGVRRYVPVFASEAQALDAVTAGTAHRRRRAQAQLPTTWEQRTRADALVDDVLRAWGLTSYVDATSEMARGLLDLTGELSAGFACALRLESDATQLVVAVTRHHPVPEDPDERPALSARGRDWLQPRSFLWGCTAAADRVILWSMRRL